MIASSIGLLWSDDLLHGAAENVGASDQNVGASAQKIDATDTNADASEEK
jgi:hypothetical protein